MSNKKVKCEGKSCTKERTTGSLISIIKYDALHHWFCKECAIGEWRNMDHLQAERVGWDYIKTLPVKELKKVAQTLDIGTMNYFFQNPKMMEKIKKSKPYKDILKQLGV